MFPKKQVGVVPLLHPTRAAWIVGSRGKLDPTYGLIYKRRVP
jgi:hypothetical protein